MSTASRSHSSPIAADTGTLTDPRTGSPRSVPAGLRDREPVDVIPLSRAAQREWARLTPGERAGRLLLFAQQIEERTERYATAERAGTGKPAADALAEVAKSVDVLRFYAGASRGAVAPGGGSLIPGRESWVRWEPLGVVAAIVPWNYPLLMAAWRIAPALAAGNTVVLKPAETTPDTALLLAQDAAEVLGPDVLLTLPGGRETGRRLVESPVDAVAFTGSQAAGLDVLHRAGLRRTSLELGGNGPVLVFPDAPAHVFDSILDACVYNAGQSCASPARVIALETEYRRTVDGLVAAAGRRRAGTSFGPLNNPQQVERYDRIVAASAAQVNFAAGLDLAPGEEDGYWRPARIMADLPDDDPAVLEEVFGPVLTVQSASTVDHAIELANGVPQALAGSVWGSDTATLLTAAAAVDCGEVWINCHLDQTPELPHGGRKSSGHGTDLSVLALTEYQRPKCVTVAVS